MSKKVLVIEDSFLLSKTIDLWLTMKGYHVKTLSSGADAVKYLFQETPDLIVLDVRLPDCDGWFIARLVRNLDTLENIPIIVISVLAPDRRQLAELRPYAYFQKPFDMGYLTETVALSLATDRNQTGRERSFASQLASP